MKPADKGNKKNDLVNSSKEELTPLEIKRIKEAINRLDTDKFLLFTRLMRIHFMLKNATITKK